MKLLKLALVAALVAFVGNVFSQELIPNKHPKSQFDVNYTTTQQEAFIMEALLPWLIMLQQI